MAYLTDRKRATGLGSSKTGTEHFWQMQVSSVALAILIPLFIFTFGRIVGGTHAEVTAYFARPVPAIIAGLTIVTGFLHFKNGAQVMIEDYAQGATRKALIIGVTCLSYLCMATGLFALIRMAL
jgi:succinate dehydrogenase / fumarate reductase, membrane anchor subunit